MPISLRQVLGLSMIALLSACAGADEPDPEAEVEAGSTVLSGASSLLERGMSQEDVRNRLGEPRTRVTMEGGYERWTYYAYDSQGQIAAKTLIIFGSDGKIVEVNDM